MAAARKSITLVIRHPFTITSACRMLTPPATTQLFTGHEHMATSQLTTAPQLTHP